MTAASQHPTTGPARCGRRLPPRQSRRVSRFAARKLVSGFFGRKSPSHAQYVASLTLGTHQENSLTVVTMVLGCAVAPNSAGTDYVLPINVKVDGNGMPSTRTQMTDADYATFQTKYGNAVVQIMDSLGNVISQGNIFSPEFVNASQSMGAMAYLLANQDKWHLLQSTTGVNTNFPTKNGPATAWTGENFKLGRESVPGYITLAHELWHTYDRLTLPSATLTQLKNQSTYGPQWSNDLEYRATTIMENSVRAGTPGSAPRTSHQ